MRLLRGMLILSWGALLVFASSGFAENQSSLEYRVAMVQGNTYAWTDPEKTNYLGMGKDYLRQIIRQNIMRYLSDQNLTSDDSETYATVDVASWFLTESQRSWDARVRMMVEDDMRQYFVNGGALPLRMEIASWYQLFPNVRFNSLLGAPIQSRPTLKLGTTMNMAYGVESRLQYAWLDRLDPATGLDVGFGWVRNDWRFGLNYHLTLDNHGYQNLSIDKSF
jgi:hypothetical protein